MPDLTIETTFVCATNTHWERDVKGSKGDIYTVRWERDFRPNAPTQYRYTCPCRGFKFGKGKECSHIRDHKDERCAWNQEMEPGAIPAVKDGEPCCPECGGPVEVIRVAV